MSDQIKVILVDDHPMVLEGIKACIEEDAGINVVATASDVASLLAHPALNTAEVVVLDINLPDMTGIDAIAHVKAVNPWIKVMIFSIHRNVDYVRNAMVAGAAGYACKDALPADLIQAIQTVWLGGSYMPPDIAAAMALGRSTVTGLDKTLTDRELEILRKIADGASSKGIAQDLDVSVRTVETHRRNLKNKLGAKSSSECVSIAMSNGLIDPAQARSAD